MADAPWLGEKAYLDKFGGDDIPADSKDHMSFSAKMKAKAWNRKAEAQSRANFAAMSDAERMQHMMQVGPLDLAAVNPLTLRRSPDAASSFPFAAQLPNPTATPQIHLPQVMLEEAELSKGLTKEQNHQRIKMEKIGWEQEDR